MLATAAAVFAEFQPPRIIAPIFLGGVIALFALRTGQSYHRPDVLSSHVLLSNLSDDAGADRQATLTDGELGALLQSNRRYQFHIHVHIVTRHDHLHAFG